MCTEIAETMHEESEAFPRKLQVNAHEEWSAIPAAFAKISLVVCVHFSITVQIGIFEVAGLEVCCSES